MKHQETLKRIREEKSTQRLIQAFYEATSGQVHDEVIEYQKYLTEELKALKAQLEPLVTAVNNHLEAVEGLQRGVENIEIPETDLSAVQNGLQILARQISEIDVSPVVNVPDMTTPVEPIVRAVQDAFPEEKTWTFTVKRDNKGLITEVIAS